MDFLAMETLKSVKGCHFGWLPQPKLDTYITTTDKSVTQPTTHTNNCTAACPTHMQRHTHCCFGGKLREIEFDSQINSFNNTTPGGAATIQYS